MDSLKGLEGFSKGLADLRSSGQLSSLAGSKMDEMIKTLGGLKDEAAASKINLTQPKQASAIDLSSEYDKLAGKDTLGLKEKKIVC